MKLVWLFLVAVVTINLSNAKSIKDKLSEKEINKANIAKELRTSRQVIAARRSNSILQNMSDRRRKLVVIPKPTKTEIQITKNVNQITKTENQTTNTENRTIKTENQTTETEKKGNRLMKNLPIKYVNYYGTTRLPAEITTRKSLMLIRRFTVKPHAVYAESVREKYDWNNHKKINTNNSKKSKSKSYTTEKNTRLRKEEDSLKHKFSNFKNVGNSIYDNDSDELEKEQQKNIYVAAGSQKYKTIVPFPTENNTKYLNVDNEQKTSKSKDENKSDSENKISSDVNNQNITITEEKNIATDKVLIKSDPKDNSSDQGKTDRSEFMLKNSVNNNVTFVGTNIISTSPAGVVGDVEMPTHSNSDFIVI